jgi:FAD/FMN-containing dehydrogenase
MQEGLYAIVGSAGRGALEANYRLDDAAPFAVVAPASESEVCALLEYTHAMRTPCIAAGSGTYLTHLVPPDRAWWLLCTRRLNRVVDYSPQDLVLTVGAGMTLHAVQELLREHRQYLPWNPALPQQATIGGIVSSNRAGSWRYRFGTPRDRLLAVRAVTPDGVAFKSGAKVVKSVAGYDLHRLLCSAWGTLAVITEITLKVQPTPQHFEAVGWQTTWDALEPTLAELMQMPLQPDGITVLALRGGDIRATALPWAAQAESPPFRTSRPANSFHSTSFHRLELGDGLTPLLEVPPASRGEPDSGSVPPCRGNLKEGVVIPIARGVYQTREFGSPCSQGEP